MFGNRTRPFGDREHRAKCLRADIQELDEAAQQHMAQGRTRCAARLWEAMHDKEVILEELA